MYAKDWKKKRIKTKKMLHAYFIIPMIILFKLFYKIKVYGRENIPRSGKFIIMANHLSHLDSFLIGYAVFWRNPRPLFYPADAKLWKLPLFRPILVGMNTIPIFKGKKDINTIKFAIKVVNSGNGMLYYPEGARRKKPYPPLQPGRLGAGWIAHATRAPIIPCFIKNVEKAMPVGKGFRLGGGPRRITLIVKFGKPLDLRKYYKSPESKETSIKIVEEIMTAIQRLGGIKDEDYPNKVLAGKKENKEPIG